jgi:hypothetical protein
VIFLANWSFVPKTLAPLKKARKLKKLAVVDIETDEWIDDTHGMRNYEIQEWHDRRINVHLLTFFDGNTTHHFTGKNSIRDFFRFYLTHAYREYVCFAHNGGKFDFIALYEIIAHDPELSQEFIVKPLLVHGRIMCFSIHDKKKHVWHFRDSYPLLLSSLDKLSESFNPLHHKMKRPSKPFHEGIGEWKTYCANDCYALYEILQMFIRIIENVGGVVGYTAPSTAMLTFRKRFLDREIPNYFPYNNIFRNSYFGGRVEVLQMHAKEEDGPYQYYDVNSLYPSVMSKFEYPVSYPLKVNYSNPEDCRGRCGIMECEIQTPEKMYLPLLPFRHEQKLIFPLGKWTGWYTFPFIEKALDLGYKIKPLRVYEFQSTNLFKDYVETFYKLKCEKEGAYRNIMKILLNSLYGKFGERQEREELITDPDEPIEGAYLYDDLFGYSIRKYTRFSAYHLPVIAAYVTTNAQLAWYGIAETILNKDGRLFYGDTDSMVTDRKIPTSTNLGELKLEETIIEGVFLAPKAYCISIKDGNKVVLKGFSKSFRRHITMQDFRNALPPQNDLSPFHEKVVHPASLKQIHIRKLSGFVTVVDTKSMKEVYDKRKILLPSLDTEPWTVPFPEKEIAPMPYLQPHPDYSRKEKYHRKMTPQNLTEQNLLEKLHKRYKYPKNVIMRCINLSRDSDFDLEEEVDWDIGDPEGQICRKLHQQHDLYEEYSYDYGEDLR